MLKHRAPLACLLLLLQASLCFSVVAAGGITGVFYKNELKNPIAGALVALYNADTNLLVDYTYTTSNGQFTLKAPPEKGNYYLVATKDSATQKGDAFFYDPQGAPIKFDLKYVHKDPSWFSPTYLWEKFDWFISSVLGFIVGLVYKWIEGLRDKKKERQKAREELDSELLEINQPVRNIAANLVALEQQVGAYGKSAGSETGRIVVATRKLLDESKKEAATLSARLSALSNFDSNIYKADGIEGRRSLVQLKEAVQVIQGMNVENDLVNSLLESQEDREKLLRPFNTLSESYAQLNKIPGKKN